MIGFSIKFAATEVFSLTLINPCFNSTYVQILTNGPALIENYSIFDTKRVIYFPQFEVVTFPLEKGTGCGLLDYDVRVNGKEISWDTKPLAFEERDLSFTIFSELREDVGFKNVTISAAFAEYPMIKTDVV